MPSMPRYMTIDFEFHNEFDFNLNKLLVVSLVLRLFVLRVSHTRQGYGRLVGFFLVELKFEGTIWLQKNTFEC